MIQPELGKPRRRCFSLPPADFTYGMRTVCFDGGAAEGNQSSATFTTAAILITALSIWRGHSKKDALKNKAVPGKDYIALNILAAQSGLTTVQEQSQFRACNDIRRRDKKREETSSKPHPPKDITYGIQTRLV